MICELVAVGSSRFLRLAAALALIVAAAPALSGPLPLCADSARSHCVVDGDTAWIAGEKVRIENIDTPEIHGARCMAEMRLGIAAADRLAALLGAGAISLEPAGDRDRDPYGRLLRRIAVNGEDVGERLIAEGLAHRWGGRREPWC